MQSTSGSPSQRIPTLDGWRGVAILMVLANHFEIGFRDGRMTRQFGQHGVAIFFVLSGYLITSRLRHELDATGNINLARFYLRRAFRLLPAALAFLLFISLLFHFGHHRWPQTLVPALLFYRNFGGPPAELPWTGHFWSLSIEEQFYLLWPAVFLLTRRRAGAVALALASCFAFHRLLHLDAVSLSTATQWHADGLLIGCAAALLLRGRVLPAWIILPLLASVIACVLTFWTVIPFAESVAVALLLHSTASQPRHVVSRMLEGRWISGLGRMSYSIYIWQQPFLLLTGGTVSLTVLGAALLPLFAVGSYQFIEKPAIRLGRRLEEHRRRNRSQAPAAVFREA